MKSPAHYYQTAVEAYECHGATGLRLLDNRTIRMAWLGFPATETDAQKAIHTEYMRRLLPKDTLERLITGKW